MRAALVRAFDDAGVPYGSCCCGCGETTDIARQHERKPGYVRGEPRLWRHGHQRVVDPLRSYVVEDRGFTTPCWVWARSCNDKGYGLLYLHGRFYAHRWFYEKAHGAIPADADLDHLCRVTRCVNPEHLEPVSHAVNMRRGINTRLTIDQVREIRGRFLTMEGTQADRSRALAPLYGVSASHIRAIASGHNWPEATAHDLGS